MQSRTLSTKSKLSVSTSCVRLRFKPSLRKKNLKMQVAQSFHAWKKAIWKNFRSRSLRLLWDMTRKIFSSNVPYASRILKISNRYAHYAAFICSTKNASTNGCCKSQAPVSTARPSRCQNLLSDSAFYHSWKSSHYKSKRKQLKSMQ